MKADDHFTPDHIQEYSDPSEEAWEDQRAEVLDLLRVGDLKILRGPGGSVYCPCQPTKKPYVSQQALLQHVDASLRLFLCPGACLPAHSSSSRLPALDTALSEFKATLFSVALLCYDA